MIKDQLIKQITEACAKVNPEILELKFGCKVDPKNKALGVGIFLAETSDVGCISWKVFYPEMKTKIAEIYESRVYETTWLFGLKPDMEILGRDITLADVLHLLKGEIMVDGYGEFYKDIGMSGEYGYFEDQPTWNLLLPPLWSGYGLFGVY